MVLLVAPQVVRQCRGFSALLEGRKNALFCCYGHYLLTYTPFSEKRRRTHLISWPRNRQERDPFVGGGLLSGAALNYGPLTDNLGLGVPNRFASRSRHHLRAVQPFLEGLKFALFCSATGSTYLRRVWPPWETNISRVEAGRVCGGGGYLIRRCHFRCNFQKNHIAP